MVKVDAAIDHADRHAETGSRSMRGKCVDDLHVPLAEGKLIRPRHFWIAREAERSRSRPVDHRLRRRYDRRNTSDHQHYGRQNG
jgi:hypothetical protein